MDSLTNLQSVPREVEDGGVGADKDDGISVCGACNDHLDTSSSAGLGCDFNFVQLAKEPIGVGGSSEQGNTGISGVASGVVRKVADDDGGADLLCACADDGNREVGEGLAFNESSVKIHIDWSGKNVPIDWSPLGGRKVINHPDGGCATNGAVLCEDLRPDVV